MAQEDFDPFIANFLPSKKNVRNGALALLFLGAAAAIGYPNRDKIEKTFEKIHSVVCSQSNIAPPQ
ncbi:MAG: hypothetical protein KDJ35_05545 [Alphaproteobacteria bacterium]|nr:hypothetical protein [Alphaproteobacteria bacterium]